jgi:hypothetical protein
MPQLRSTDGAHLELYRIFKIKLGILWDRYLSIIRPYLYSLLPGNTIKSGRFVLNTLYNTGFIYHEVERIWKEAFMAVALMNLSAVIRLNWLHNRMKYLQYSVILTSCSNFAVYVQLIFTRFLFSVYVENSVALMYYATSRKVAGSRPDEVNECFQFT